MNTDAYLVKPSANAELVAGPQTALRPPPTPPPLAGKVKLPTGVADLGRSEIRHDNGQRCELSEREAQLLRYLAAHRGRAISRDEILWRVWRLDPRRMLTRTIDMHIAKLRGKLGDQADHPKVLLTVRGQGYMLAAGNGR
ncbi:MAG TPA: winged helix-turn-helix domain-containing protein [Candidatus Binatia bacterium]|nr:winged helix-turn-helix domain-containing protein [Candidatus Binatia bacterium]